MSLTGGSIKSCNLNPATSSQYPPQHEHERCVMNKQIHSGRYLDLVDVVVCCNDVFGQTSDVCGVAVLCIG